MNAAGFRAAGMSDRQAREKGALLGQAHAALGKLKPVGPPRSYFVPGRLECLGKHTDYAGGRSLVCPIDRGFVLTAAAREDAAVHVVDAATGERADFQIAADLQPPPAHWSNYPMTVAARLARNFGPDLRGADIAFRSDLPPAAGMSSSSAMMIAVYLALAEANALSRREEYRRNIDGPEALAGYLATIENGQTFGTLTGSKGVGTFGGSEDHTAILCGRAGELSCYSYCPVRLERTVPLPDGYVFAVAASGVTAAKTGDALDKYNRASQSASAAVGAWNEATGRSDAHLAAALAAAPAKEIRAALGQADDDRFTAQEMLDRFEHFLAESEQIVPDACDALATADWAEFARQTDRSQDLAQRLLRNQVPETVFLAQTARESGAVGASAFGAGFGGAVWALIPAEDAKAFLADWSARYRKAFPETHPAAGFFLTRPGPPAFTL